jgi:hypothetical protein
MNLVDGLSSWGNLIFVGIAVAVVLAVAWFAGARDRVALLGMALCTGPLLWLMFDFALKVHMPPGVWLRLLVS